MKGRFIVFEGVDGSGKSTLVESVADSLREKGYTVDVTQEPTHGEIGSIIREGRIPNITQKAESLLFVADRAVHTQQMMEQVEQGHIVLCDRYFASTIAYQSASLDGDSMDRDWLLSLNMPVIAEPAITILLDIDVEKSLERVGKRGELSKFEKAEYLSSVRAEYLRLAKEFGFTIINADQSREDVLAQAINKIEEVL